MYNLRPAASSNSTISSNDTASNIVGPGRNLGKFYEYAGFSLERRWSKLARKIKKIEKIEAREPSVISNEIDALSISSFSTNFTKSNIPGPGRNLGQFYEYLGHRLERRANRVAEKHLHRGPDVSFRELSARRKRGRHRYSDQDDYSKLSQQKDLVKACQRLVDYASSSVPQNQYVALQHIVALSLEDESLRRLFLTLGLADYLRNFDPNVIYYRDLSVRDAIVTSSKKALICFEENLLFQIGKEIDTFPCSLQRFEAGAYHLVNYFSHPEKSFLAMRLLRNAMRHFSPYEWNLIFNYSIETIAGLATSLRCDLEWDSVDDILNRCVKEYLIASMTKYSPDLLGKVVQTIIRRARHLPATMATLRLHLDISMGGISVGGPTQVLVDGLISMDQSEDDRDIGLDARLKSLSVRFPDPALGFMWNCLSFGPGIVMTQITSRLDICGATGLPRNVVDSDEQRRSLCTSLASFITDVDFEKRRDAIENIEETMELDYFHKRDVLNGIARIFEETKDAKVFEVARSLWDIVMTRRLLDASPTHIRHEPHDVFRHRARNGDLHIRFEFAFGPRHPCSQCISLGIWNDMLQSDRLVSEKLYSVTNVPHEGARPFAGWMRVARDGPFDRARYRPVSAGAGRLQEPLYLCDITHSVGFEALQDQTNRIVCPGYFREDGQLQPIVDDPGILTRIVSLSVLSVYTPCLDWMTGPIYAAGGKDITEPFYWK